MNINEASIFLKDLQSKTERKSEIKTYQCFLKILSSLERRNLEQKQLNLIENKLEDLNLTANNNNRKRYIRKKLAAFKEFLKKEFSFVTEGYYKEYGMSIGMVFGISIGVAIGNSFGGSTGTSIGISTGIGVGMVIGMAIGITKDAEAKKKNLVLN